ncbi:MAG: Rpn family recombination-promoting nuclease/putative transposase [Fibrobacteres bacterium]|nr:Rpn family recombination-promoting nuclease/putative transposase [Fibrobacterota bacterium]
MPRSNSPRKPSPAKKHIDHDGLHKQLLTHFFEQFIEGFFPEVAAHLDFSDFGPENILSQELFPELPSQTHRLDFVAKVRPKNSGTSAYLIVFIETQGKRHQEFLARVFRYFALLHIKFATVVIPIVIYADTSRKPLADRWTHYEIAFAGHRFLDFRFLAVHPSSLPVRDFLNSHNPAQLALAARMDLGSGDMVQIKLDLLRQMAKLAMTEAQIENAVLYLEAYFEPEDSSAFQRELALLAKQEYREAGMLIEHFRKIGLAEGRAQGLEQGRQEGLEKGYEEGIEKGLEEGIMKGIEKGLEKGMEKGMQKGMEKGMEKGFRASKLEDARKMREHGIDWAIVTDVTGIVPADLA